MNLKLFATLKSYLFGWFIANVIWTMASYVNPNELNSIDGSVSSAFSIFLITWILQGFFYGLLQYFIDKFITRRVTFIRLQVYSIILQALLAIGLVILTHSLLKITAVISNEITILDFVKSIKGIWLAFLFALLVNFTINLFCYIDLTLGKGNLFKIIKGSFYNPKESNQVFMFLDLKGSTTLAERLGHMKYSELIQDCFFDLAVVDNFKAKVYQYVGDEAVLTWSLENGTRDGNCLNAYFAFEEAIAKRADYYNAKYGEIPQFKAGVNSGTVMITEVGNIKREIAYHGDTLNVAARLEGECNRLKVNLIISEKLLKLLKLGDHYDTTFVGDIQLRGKQGFVKMHSVTRV